MATTAAKHPRLLWVVLVVFLVSAPATQIVIEGALQRPPQPPGVYWVQSPDLMRRLAVGFNAIWADVYWIRAVQYFGDTRLSSEEKNYDRLYPLLDITTSLDPHFNIAYRLGSILLSEGYPNGPGQTDKALMLLQKGIREMPDKWQYYHDAGFVEYWWHRDSKAAADWFVKGSKLPGAPTWLEPLAASVLAEGGERDAARAMWRQLEGSAEHDWLRTAAQRGLMQLDAEAHIDVLEALVHKFYDMYGRFPDDWQDLTRIKLLPGIPVDPSGTAYTVDPVSGSVNVSPGSSLYPLRSRAR